MHVQYRTQRHTHRCIEGHLKRICPSQLARTTCRDWITGTAYRQRCKHHPTMAVRAASYNSKHQGVDNSIAILAPPSMASITSLDVCPLGINHAYHWHLTAMSSPLGTALTINQPSLTSAAQHLTRTNLLINIPSISVCPYNKRNLHNCVAHPPRAPAPYSQHEVPSTLAQCGYLF